MKASHPVIDILVCNAGAIKRQPAAEHADENWDEVMEVDLRRLFRARAQIRPGDHTSSGGKIIFTVSLLSFQGGITVPGHAASKGGIAQLTTAFSSEWAGRGVCVNAIAPGLHLHG